MYASVTDHLETSVSGSTPTVERPTAMLTVADSPPALAVTVTMPEPVDAAVKGPAGRMVPRDGGSTVQCTAEGGRATAAPPAAVAEAVMSWVPPLSRSAR